MNNFFDFDNNLFTHEFHLKNLITETGIKNIYDATAQCTRCGYCLENCPTYITEKKETLSPRARNQIVRMLVKGKFKNPDDASYTIDTCLLCSACTNICYGSVPTADIVLEARREMKNFGRSKIYTAITKLRHYPKLFDFILKTLYFFKKIKLSELADFLGLFKILGMPSLSKAHRKLITVPDKFLHQQNEIKKLINKKAKWIYFLTCGTDYVYDNVGKATINVLTKIYGEGYFINNTCCGLISYNYGNLKDSKKYALENIEKFMDIKKNNPNVFIVADCSSCVAFLKKYPQLFADEEENLSKAKEFSESVKDVIEVIKPEYLNSINWDFIKDKKIAVHHSCKAHHDQKLTDVCEKVLKPILKERLVELEEKDMCCGGAGAYMFTKPEFSEKILERKLKNIAQSQADIVIASATSCLMQISWGLKQKYPNCKIMHYIEFIDKLLIESN